MKQAKYVVFLIFLLQFAVNLYASSNEKNTSAAVIALKIEQLINESKTDSIKFYRVQLNSKFIPEISQKNLCICYRAIGNYHASLNNIDSTFHFFNKALSVSDRLDMTEKSYLKATIWFYQAKFFCDHSDYKSALELLLAAENTFKSIDNKTWLAETYNKLGGIYIYFRDTLKVVKYCNLTLQYAVETHDTLLITKGLIAKANSLYLSGDTLGFTNTLFHALELCRKYGFYHYEGTICYNLGHYYSSRNNFEKSLKYYHQSYIMEDKSNNLFDKCDALYKIGFIYIYLGKFNTARDTLLSALNLAGKIPSVLLQRNIYDALATLEDTLGNYHKAYEYLGLSYDLHYEVFSDQNRIETNFLSERYNAAQRESKISFLQSLQKLQDEKIKKRNLLLTFLILIIIIISILAYLYSKYLRQKSQLIKKDNLIQAQKIEELVRQRQVSATHAVLEGETKERKRISRDMHDGLGSMLSLITLKLSTMKGNLAIPEELVKGLDLSVEMMNNAITELRRIVHNLMPESLFRMGMNVAIRDFCSGNEIINYQFYGHDTRIDEKLEVTIFRIVTELVNNSLKHANANSIYVQLIQENTTLNINVSDDGKGFNPEIIKSVKGKGIASIQSRVDAFNGKMDISSQIGKGTETNIEFYIKDNV